MKDALDGRRRIFPAPLFRTAVMPGDRLPDVGMERFADGTGFGRALQDFLVFVAVIARQVEIEPDLGDAARFGGHDFLDLHTRSLQVDFEPTSGYPHQGQHTTSQSCGNHVRWRDVFAFAVVVSRSVGDNPVTGLDVRDFGPQIAQIQSLNRLGTGIGSYRQPYERDACHAESRS